MTALPPMLDEARKLIAQHGGVRLAIAFGSQTTGKATATSDLDLAVDADPDVSAALAASLSSALGLELDIVSLPDLTIPLLDAVIQDGVLLHEGRPGVAASWRSHALADLELDRPWYARMRDAWLRRVAERGAIHGE